VIFVPGLHGLFCVADITAAQVGIIVALALAPTVLIQIIKVIIDNIKK
jgi:Ca2+-transporting ATPase